jgi:uncharacterized iron-regulated protein
LRLELKIDERFVALAESDRAEKTENGYVFELDNHDGSMVLAFSDRWQVKTENHKGVEIATYFTEDNARFSGKYFDRIKELLDLYTGFLGDFPYGRFVVADVPYPVGHALVGLTFISERIIPMSFLTEVSLGHELLHQWFGVAVDADTVDGNWAEGLTTYMADRLYAEMKGEGVPYRKSAILNHMANSRQKEDGTCLLEFYYKKDKTSQAVGYSRAMLVFSMYEMMLGEDKFREALGDIVERYKYKSAGWHDLRAAFDKAGNISTEDFLDGWLSEMAIADFTVSKVAMKAVAEGYEVTFKIKNKYKWHEYPLEVIVSTKGGEVKEYLYVEGEDNEFSVKTGDIPLQLLIDPDFRIPRMLTDSEMRPAMYNLFSKYEKAVFVKEEERAIYSAFIDSLENAEVFSDEESPFKHLDKNLIFLGSQNKAFKKVYGFNSYTRSPFMVKAYKHPVDKTRMSYSVVSASEKMTMRNVGRISHYGKYSGLELGKGGRFVKTIDEGENGISFSLYDEKQGVRVTSPLTVQQIVAENIDKKVFLVGETHTSYEHHVNQLEVVKELVNAGKDVAIGLEMVQKPFQVVLDDYISGKISQDEMIDKTEYFSRWKFDFRLYKMIFDYARENKIPLVALNLETEITKKVSSEGIDSLSDEELAKIPSEIEFTDGRYKKNLEKVFNMHPMKSDFDNFYQAQILWDETMADSAHRFMKANPEKTLVIIAGNGHLRYKDSIPERLKRRSGEDYVSIMQDADFDEGIADYILYPAEIDFQESPKMGVYVDDTEEGLQVKKVIEDSFAEKSEVKDGDFIIEFDGKKIVNLVDLKTALMKAELEKNYGFKVRRDGEEVELNIVFEEKKVSPH